MDALGNSNDYVVVLLPDCGDIFQELVHVEVNLRQVNQVSRITGDSSQRSSASQPACVTAHDLDDGYLTLVVYVGILVNLSDGGSDILCCGSEARAMVGAEQVVVDGLRDTHDTAVIANLLHILGNLVTGVHGVVAAVVEEVTNVVLLEDLEDALVIGIVNVRICDLVTAGTQSRGRGVLQQLQLSRIFLFHNVQLIVQYADDAVCSAVNSGDSVGIKTGLDCTVSAGVDNRSRATGLTDDHCTF